jgi:hypothetical protein
MKKETKFFILYANGHAEIVKEKNETFLRQIKNGIVGFILDMTDNKVTRLNPKTGQIEEIDIEIV